MFGLLLCLAVAYLVAADQIIFHDGPIESYDEDNKCICSIELPDTTFPSHLMVILENAYKNLTGISEEEALKVMKLQTDLAAFNETMKKLTATVEKIEMEGVKDDEAYKDILEKINNTKRWARDLSQALSEAGVGIAALSDQVSNISSIVWELEKFDDNKVLLTHREIASLKKQLADCEDSLRNPNSGLSASGNWTPEFGKCDNKVMLNISKPLIVKLNWRGLSYKFGAWGKDFAVGNKNPDKYWVAPLNTDERLLETYRIYNSYSELLLYKNQIEKTLSQFVGFTWNYINCGQGSGTILYNGSFYYNCYNSRNLCKLDLATNKVQRKVVEDAVFNNWYSYNGVNWQDFDFSGDENGLWIIYSSEKSKGKIKIGQLDPNTLTIVKSWQTSLYKPKATGTFMICGVMYALMRESDHKEKIFYKYDTNTATEGTMDIILEKLTGTPQSINYNPNDHKLYMYNDGYLVSYDVIFRRVPLFQKRSVVSVEEPDTFAVVGKNHFSSRDFAIA
ncbi:olfactomedin-like [Zootoca vivipara]|uniref:olfactomedin-like n=1 Tax=Zootoca vivipara TaxID=8524 RepID=UPI0015902133|nr:olfactomedin-like [Zootoca vivipara]